MNRRLSEWKIVWIGKDLSSGHCNKTPETRWLKLQRGLYLAVLAAGGVQGQSPSRCSVWARTCFLLCRRPFCCVLTAGREGKHALGSPLGRALIPARGPHPHILIWTKSLRQLHLLIPSQCGLGPQCVPSKGTLSVPNRKGGRLALKRNPFAKNHS